MGATIRTLSAWRTAVAAALALLGAESRAAGFLVVEQGVHEVGRAVSGASAAADSPGTLFFNPAGITYLDGTQAAAALHVIVPQAEFSGESSRNPQLGGTTIETGNGEDGGAVGLVPNLYYVRDLTRRLKFGLGINAPFGLVTEYDDGWAGRYHAIRSDLLTLNLNPTLALRVNDRVSVGFGVSAVYAEAELSNAIDLSSACLAKVDAPTCAGAGLATPADPATDGKVVVQADDWAFGFNLGLLVDLTDSTRLGLAYRSRVVLDGLDGDADFTLPAAGAALSDTTGLFKDSGVTTELELPDTLSVGIHHRVDERWSLMADVTWTHWSVYDVLVVKFDNPAQPDNVQPNNWDDSLRYSLGMEYRPVRQWTWRAGVAYDETPIPSAVERTPRLPGNDRTWVALGFSWTGGERISLDFAYAHLFIDDAPIENVEVNTGHLLSGEFDHVTDILSAQLSYRF